MNKEIFYDTEIISKTKQLKQNKKLPIIYVITTILFCLFLGFFSGRENKKIEIDNKYINYIQSYGYSYEYSKFVYNNIKKYSKVYSVDKNIVLSIIAIGSKFNYRAVSKTGNIGLMQIKGINYYMDTEKLFNIETNISLGCYILMKDGLDKYCGSQKVKNNIIKNTNNFIFFNK